jgi:N-acetylmuramoyl-L-alanine amidase
LEAGHGGEDNDAISKTHGLKEKALTLDVALRDILSFERKGFQTNSQMKNIFWEHCNL